MQWNLLGQRERKPEESRWCFEWRSNSVSRKVLDYYEIWMKYVTAAIFFEELSYARTVVLKFIMHGNHIEGLLKTGC